MSTSPEWSDWPGRGRQRIAEVIQSAETLRTRIDSWLDRRRGDRLFARFTGHFDVLGSVLARMLSHIEATLDAPSDPGANPGANPGSGSDTRDSVAVYRRCRETEKAIVQAAQLFDWYASKYDQRLGPAAKVLAAADELVRSCWSQTYAELGMPVPTAPLPYLDARFDALATPRVSVPSDLTAPQDAAVVDCVLALPPATIALPMQAADRGWWLVLIAHEVGHHVCTELGLESAIRAAIRSAGSALENPLPCVDQWNRWSLETFADVYSVLMVGGAAGWALAELQHATPADLAQPPPLTSRYPAPLVRLAVIGETARQAGIPSAVPDAAEALAWLDALGQQQEQTQDREQDGQQAPRQQPSPASRTTTAEHLAGVPSVVSRLLNLPLNSAANAEGNAAPGKVSTLQQVAAARPEWFAPEGRINAWAGQLRRPTPATLGRERREAARQAVAAAVSAYDALARSTDTPPESDVRLLHTNLITLLADCGGPGLLAAAPTPSQDLDSLADQLADHLLAAASESMRRRTDPHPELLDSPPGAAR